LTNPAPAATFNIMNENDLIYDWNARGAGYDYSACRVQLNDETLRDGLQSPSVIDPPMERKLELLHVMVDLGIHSADIGLPGAGPRHLGAVRMSCPSKNHLMYHSITSTT